MTKSRILSLTFLSVLGALSSVLASASDSYVIKCFELGAPMGSEPITISGTITIDGQNITRNLSFTGEYDSLLSSNNQNRFNLNEQSTFDSQTAKLWMMPSFRKNDYQAQMSGLYISPLYHSRMSQGVYQNFSGFNPYSYPQLNRDTFKSNVSTLNAHILTCAVQ